MMVGQFNKKVSVEIGPQFGEPSFGSSDFATFDTLVQQPFSPACQTEQIPCEVADFLEGESIFLRVCCGQHPAQIGVAESRSRDEDNGHSRKIDLGADNGPHAKNPAGLLVPDRSVYPIRIGESKCAKALPRSRFRQSFWRRSPGQKGKPASYV
jgi:hypothetical protein